ncbi:hypothetical protein EQO05_00970 [Methanosarcina sp. MSH10X1]|uniref:hypothetical protein n=1 Tax=Methanosarcina sp. MSH10X1 TaxID=2507075 RepID=UPI000FFC893C|nr:hypothetical protein [Methanosarcina sp. MSH10X1]RXA21840.1 hypothetical protein EQO05_00970 [Methanosarcina sp. MSH10X1]
MAVKKATKQKYKIVIELPFGHFRTMEEASQMKKRVKAKSPKIVFSACTKSSRGVAFKGRLSYVQAFSAPVAAVKQVLQSRAPGAKVSVTRA